MTAVEQFWQDVQDVLPPSSVGYETATKLGIAYEQAKEMEKEQKIEFAKLHVQTALKAVENEMILQASSVKHWYLPETIK